MQFLIYRYGTEVSAFLVYSTGFSYLLEPFLSLKNASA